VITMKSHQDQLRRRRAATVSQAELARLVELRRLDAERNRLRDSILKRLLAGADVQEGELTPRVSHYEPAPLSWKQLGQVLEEGFIRELKKALNQPRHRRLEVS